MVTGDFALTAQATAANCGIISNIPDKVNNVSTLCSTDERTTTIYQVPANEEHKGLKTLRTSIILRSSELIILDATE